MHWRGVLAVATAGGLLFVVLWLFQVPTEAALYWLLLVAVALGIPLVVHFFSFRRDHLALSRLLHEPLEAADYLPAPENLLEEDYQALILSLVRGRQELETEMRQREQERLAYYSHWVHQIKTPIAAMDLLLQGDELPTRPELSEQLFKIEQYTEMVLTYLRSENQSADLSIQRQSLDAIIKDAVKKYAKIFIRSKIALDYQETGMEMLTDKKWLTFVIEQILSNSLKYTPSGGNIRIWGSEGKLLIADNGIGIPSEDLPRIFEWGYTGYTGRIYEKSTGIGLFLCRRVLNHLSHTIEIESAVGEGTKVILGLESITLEAE